MSIDAVTVRDMLLFVAKRIIGSKELLTQADSAIGDGDHGIGMAGGMEKAAEALLALDPLSNAYAVFSAAGQAMLMNMGGASGVIFGSLYLGGAKGHSAEALTPADLADFFARSLQVIQARGGAKVGDKTMIDALSPAVDAMQAHCADGLVPMLLAAKEAARGGVERTKNLVARFGRAKSLGERALGHADAGATSVAIIFEAMYDFCLVRASA